MNSGLPTVFLDVRTRPRLLPPSPPGASGAARRTALIEAAKSAYESWCAALRAEGLADTLDACTLAHFHDVLAGDGDSSTLDFTGETSGERNGRGMPLWRAIQLLRMQERVLQTADGAPRSP